MTGTDKERLLGIKTADKDSSAYPPLLREIYDPPQAIYYRGKLPCPERPALAIVGTRRPGPAASVQALALGRECARRGITVISGLALGIDALAHRGCLEAGGITAAVLGSAVDEVYPASNRLLARRILESGGALLSEYPSGTKPRKWHFPQRNRIISGMARGTVIVEAPVSSGALYTARFALEQGRDLFAASGGIKPPVGEGTRRLAEDGCRVISSIAEILAEWGINAELIDIIDTIDKNGGSMVSTGFSFGGAASAFALAQSLRQELDL